MKHKIWAPVLLIVATLLAAGLVPVSASQPGEQALDAVPSDAKPLRPIADAATLPAAVTPDPLIQEMIDQVDSTTVLSYTGDLSGMWPVEIGGNPYTILTRNTRSGTPILKATQYAGEHLAGLGLDVEYQSWTGGGGTTGRNVIGEITGESHPDDVYIICAHLDDMPSSGAAPGADDNASGSAAVLVAADILSQYHWGCTLRFALWTGEEQGLYGSEAYAYRAYMADENIVGVLNLDMIAWNKAGSVPGIDLYADPYLPATVDLANLFDGVVDAYNLSLSPQVILDANETGSDHASFWDYDYTAILAIEDFDDFNPNYHTTNDTQPTLDQAYFTEFVKASVGTMAHMSNCLLRPEWYFHYYLPLVASDAAE